MITIGQITEATVTGLKDFGAFVVLQNGETAMVHISQVSNTYVKNIHEYLSEGQEVKVKVIAIDEKGRISLSMKQAQENKPNKVKNIGYTQKAQDKNEMNFEDMMLKFKQSSDEKMNALKKSSASKYSSYSRRVK